MHREENENLYRQDNAHGVIWTVAGSNNGNSSSEDKVQTKQKHLCGLFQVMPKDKTDLVPY